MKLIIVDDDLLIRKSLAMVLTHEPDIEVVGEAENGTAALALCEKTVPDVALMDIRMPGVDGIAATKLIKDRYPNIKIMILTTFADKMNIQQALTAGADGYLVKTDDLDTLPNKLRTLMGGSGIIDPSVLDSLRKPANSLLDKLSPREKDITRLVAQGLTNKEISNQLFLSEGTVKNKILDIMKKLNVSNRTQLGIIYYDNI